MGSNYGNKNKPPAKAGYVLKYSKKRGWEYVPTEETQKYISTITSQGGYNDLIFGEGLSLGEQTALLNERNAQASSTLLSRSVYKIVDLIGEGPIQGFYQNSGAFGAEPLTSTYFDGVRVRNFDGSFNFNLTGVQGFTGSQAFGFNYTLGETGGSGIPGFRNVENFLQLPTNTRIAKMPPKHGETKDIVVPIYKKDYPDIQGVKVTVKVPALFNVDDKGNNKAGQILYSVKGRADNGPEFDLLPIRPIFSGKKLTDKKQTLIYKPWKPILGIANSNYLDTDLVFNAAFQADWKTFNVRVVRESENIVSNRAQNELYIESLAVIGSNNYSYPSTALTALTFNSQQFGQVPVRSYDIMGLQVTVPSGYTPPFPSPTGYTSASYPNIWLGNFDSTKKWTSNPAWVFYDLLTNKRYGLGDYFPSTAVDKWSLYEISRYCDELVDDGDGGLEPRFAVNVVIQERQDAYELLQNLASSFQGMTYWANGKIFANTSKDYPAYYSFTNANVIDGSFLYADTARNTRSTVIKVKWKDPDNLFKEDVVKIEDTDGILRYGYIEKDVASFGCTSRGQATRVANWILETERLLTETVTFSTFLEGISLRPGDNFNVYDNFRNNKSQGGRVLSVHSSLTGVYLDRSVNLDFGKTYELSVVRPTANTDDLSQITGSNQFSGIRAPQIDTKTVFSVPGSGLDFLGVSPAFGSGIEKGAIWTLNCVSTGLYADFSKPYRCLASAEIEPGKIEILGVEITTGIVYRASTGYNANGFPSIPFVPTPITPPTNLVVTSSTGIEIGKFFSNYSLNWTPSNSDNVLFYNISGDIAGAGFFNIAQIADSSYVNNFSNSGYYRFAVGAVSEQGVHSSYITGGILFSMTTNPLGGPVGVSGVLIDYNQDESRPLTGYIDREFAFEWEIEAGDEEYYSPKTAFFSGFKISVLNPDTNTIVNTDVENQIGGRAYFISQDDLTGYGLPVRRDVKVRLESVDVFGGITTPLDTLFYNHPPRSPISSGFEQLLGGMQYSISADSRDSDISGLYLWANELDSFVPNFSNASLITDKLSDFYSNSYSDPFYVWFSLLDTFGTGETPIYGPVQVVPSINVVTGIRSDSNPYLRNGVTFSGRGGVSLSQQGQTIIVSGERSPFNLGFFLENPPDETGIAIGELISSKGFVFTGYSVSCRTVGNTNLSGSFYYCDLDNSNRTSLGNYGLIAGQTNRSQTLPFIEVPQLKKIGYDMTILPTDAEKISLGLFGFDVK